MCNQASASGARTWQSRPFVAAVPVLAAFAACDAGPGIGQAHFALAEPGPWNIPPQTLAIGDEQYVDYTGAGPWLGESECADGLLPGAEELRGYIESYFSQVDSIGGFSCRAIVGDSSSMSVHATGRALDIMIPTTGGEADNSLGDPLGNWLIENAEDIGIQYIIWDNWTWRADRSSPKDGSYGGSHPHHDHLHIELSTEAANLGTSFFERPFEPPVVSSCGTIPPEGGVVENTDDCARFFGSSEYWRSADGEGHSGSLLWTNAFESDQPSNWARWSVDLAEAGRYRAEVYLAPEYAVFDEVRYEILHGGVADVVFVDQSAADEEGWYPIGEFEFAAGGGQHISLFDNATQPVGEEQRIAFDALRLVPHDAVSDPREDGAPSPDPDPEPGADPRLGSSEASIAGGCAAGGGANGGALSLVLLAWYARRLGRGARAVRRPAGVQRAG